MAHRKFTPDPNRDKAMEETFLGRKKRAESLFTAELTPVAKVVWLPLDLIVVRDDLNPRKDLGDVKSLVSYLKKAAESEGLEEAVSRFIVEVELTPTGEFHLIKGKRRLEAIKLFGLNKAPAVVKKASEGDAKRILEMMAENLLRKDLTPTEKAKGAHSFFVRFLEERGGEDLSLDPQEVTPSKIAYWIDRLRKGHEVHPAIREGIELLEKHTGASPRTLMSWFELLRLPDWLLTKIDDPNSVISTKHGHALLPLAKDKNEDLLRQAVKRIERNELSPAQTQKLVATLLEGRGSKKTPAKNRLSARTFRTSLQKATTNLDLLLSETEPPAFAIRNKEVILKDLQDLLRKVQAALERLEG